MFCLLSAMLFMHALSYVGSSNVMHGLQGTGSMDLAPPSTIPSLFNTHPSWQLSSADFLCVPPFATHVASAQTTPSGISAPDVKCPSFSPSNNVNFISIPVWAPSGFSPNLCRPCHGISLINFSTTLVSPKIPWAHG